MGSNRRGWIVRGWGGMLSLYWEFYWRDAWKVVIFQFVSTACLFSLPLSLSLFLPTSLMSAPSTHPWLSFWLHRSSFRDRWKREEEKGLQRERVTVNVGPEQIAQAAKHSVLGSTLTSIWGSLRVFCSSMWQLGCQIKLGKASGRANLLTAISRHTNTHKKCLFLFLAAPIWSRHGLCSRFRSLPLPQMDTEANTVLWKWSHHRTMQGSWPRGPGSRKSVCYSRGLTCDPSNTRPVLTVS